MTTTAILVSPAPVDGYPPVQHQARLLADAGYAVELLTTTLPWTKGSIGFTHGNVRVHSVDRQPGGAPLRASRFVAKLSALRLRARPVTAEICYDPYGLLFSDWALNRPRVRIAHFHECLQSFDTSFIESRVKRAIRGYQLVTVPDATRAELLRDQLSLVTSPTLVPNYPMAVSGGDTTGDRRNGGSSRFVVIYCGSLGTQQKLDTIIASVGDWPDNAMFHIIGNDDTPVGNRLKALAEASGVSKRVVFDGWIGYDDLLRRLASADLAISLLDSSFEQWRTALGASNKRYEYMRAGLPQIGDMNPGVKEMLEGQGIGMCVATHEPSEIARIVTAYATDPQRRAQEGARARALHLARYNYESAFQPVLDWIAKQKPVRSVALASTFDAST